MKNRTRTSLFQTWNPQWNSGETSGIQKQPQAPKWSGRYINLERSSDRRLHLENEIERHGLKNRYRRFAAIDGRITYSASKISAAEKGIFASHLAVLEQAAAGSEVLHIIEDDAALSSALVPFIDWIVDSNAVREYDMIFTDTFISLDSAKFQWLEKAYSEVRQGRAPAVSNGVALIDMKKNYLYSTSSYIVTPAGAARIVEILKRAWREGPTAPVDHILQHAVLAGELRFGCSMPFVTWLDLKLADASTAGRPLDLPANWTLQRLLRHLFFVDCDTQGYLVPALNDLVRSNSDKALTRDEKHTIEFAKKVLAACATTRSQS